jgi:hypothetical protein
MPAGRPRKYTEEERKQKAREKDKRRYYRKMGYGPGERVSRDRRNLPAYTMWANAKHRAATKGLPFTLVLEDIVIPDICPLLGIPIIKGRGAYSEHSPTMDRLVPSLGYTKENTWVISMRANRIKQDASLEEFELMAKNLRSKLVGINKPVAV